MLRWLTKKLFPESSSNALDGLANFEGKAFHRICFAHGIENEPTHMPKEDYYLDFLPMTGLPVWMECDRLFRERITNGKLTS